MSGDTCCEHAPASAMETMLKQSEGMNFMIGKMMLFS